MRIIFRKFESFSRYTFLLAGLLSSAAAYAAPPTLTGVTLNSWTQISTGIICPIAAVMFYMLIALTVLLVVMAAYRYLTSQGDEEKVRNATRTITYAAVAVVVAVLAKAFPLIIQSIFILPAPGC
ncbi:MAG TPA: hypothetical protein VNG29_02835 [Candidatus Paceibacterota bacterium]|nr:hypothetical protein [Candidatus Paceibacterota bacterium]